MSDTNEHQDAVCKCPPFGPCSHNTTDPAEHRRQLEIEQLAQCEVSVRASADPEDGEQCPNLRQRGSLFCDRHTVELDSPPAPRVFFPGNIVPAGTWGMNEHGHIARAPIPLRVKSGSVVEILGVPSSAAERQDVVDRARAALLEREVVHRCPPGDEGFTPCCDKTPFELPRTDRITEDDTLVTCGREEEAGAN